MKKIIYTTDYSNNSIAALKYAAAMGDLLKTDVIVLHVYPPSEEGSGKKEVRKMHQEKLLEFCKEHLKDKFDSTEISVAAVKGANVAHAISEFVRDMNVYMIVMGACGTSTFKEVLVGSTTKEMLGASPFPVLAVPADFNSDKVEKVMFASVLADEDINNLAELINILAPAKPEINVIHITHKDEEAAAKALEDFKHRVTQVINYENLTFRNIYSFQIFDTLQETIDETKPDFIVMPEHREKNELNKVIIRDRVKRMQSCTKVPLLSFPPAL
ncbi:universal stress protein [Salinimicrobium flavum]|uniref:Universal stress protein n=1 Tax=Salinimicrobium flavum TaxID=1737065 RepID=A0ABW5J2X1_9FLAO